MLASKFMQGMSSTEPDIVHSRDEDLWLMGYWQGPARRKRRKEQQQKKLWKQECYFQTEVCCSQLSILESKGTQVQGDPYKYR